MIDTHCHIDLYSSPQKLLVECEKKRMIILAMTNLPSHFELGYPHVQGYKKIRLSLGMHPLFADRHRAEFPIFLRNISRTSYIGEVGLDFSREGLPTKHLQLDTFEKILNVVADKKKILSIHSRGAEKEVLNLLVRKGVENAIFHWYSGPLTLIQQISEAGYYFSINPSMINSEAGRKIIGRIPLNRVLTETDGPFTEVNGRQAKPWDVGLVHEYFSKIWDKANPEVDSVLQANFTRLLSNIR